MLTCAFFYLSTHAPHTHTKSFVWNRRCILNVAYSKINGKASRMDWWILLNNMFEFDALSDISRRNDNKKTNDSIPIKLIFNTWIFQYISVYFASYKPPKFIAKHLHGRFILGFMENVWHLSVAIDKQTCKYNNCGLFDHMVVWFKGNRFWFGAKCDGNNQSIV